MNNKMNTFNSFHSLETIPEWCRLKEAIPNLKELQYEYNKNKMIKKFRKEHGL